jgi:hypothetical protein
MIEKAAVPDHKEITIKFKKFDMTAPYLTDISKSFFLETRDVETP